MLCLKIAGRMANSVDPAGESHGLHCLLRPICPNTCIKSVRLFKAIDTAPYKRGQLQQFFLFLHKVYIVVLIRSNVVLLMSTHTIHFFCGEMRKMSVIFSLKMLLI